jgi:hypothetical protein
VTPEWNHAYNNVLRRVMPGGWRCIQKGEDGAAWGDGRLAVILSANTELDGKRWLHISISHNGDPASLPSWGDLLAVRDTFLGEEALCLHLLPPKSEHVNIHPGVLHLWHCMDGRPTPDFTRGGSSL